MIAALAFRNVLRNKERSLLTLVGVVLAIGSFVALVSLAAGFTSRVERELGSREVHLYVTGHRTSTLPVSPLAGAGTGGVALSRELESKLKVRGVRSVTPVIRSSLDGSHAVIPVLALPLEQVRIVFKSGSWSTNPEELAGKIKVDKRPAAKAPPEEKPSVTPTPKASPAPAQSESEEVGSVHSRKVYPALVGQGLGREISGLAESGPLVIDELAFEEGATMGSHGFLDYSVIVPIDAFFEQRSDRGVHEYWLTVEDYQQVQAVKEEIEGVVKEYVSSRAEDGVSEGSSNIRVMTQHEYLRSAREYLGYGWLLQVAISMVGVLIAVTASMNTMLMSTYERLGEYATLRAVGASRRVISMTIIYEAIFLNVTGGMIGLAFGYLATGVLDKAVTLLLEIPYPMAGVTPVLLLQAIGLSFGVGIVGAIIPCFIVSRIDLVEQLRKGL